jgi:hypothetical protein
MTVIDGVLFKNQIVDIGGRQFTCCGFVDCELVNPRADEFGFNGCAFTDSQAEALCIGNPHTGFAEHMAES